MKTCLILLTLFCATVASARLGETVEQCDARYGKCCAERIPRFPGSKTRRVYVVEVFRLDVEFNEEGRAWVLYYRQVRHDHREELRYPDLYKRNEADGRYRISQNDLWKDNEPLDEVDRNASFTTDRDRREIEVKAIESKRLSTLVLAGESINGITGFFEAYYPGASVLTSYDGHKPTTGYAGMMFDIYQANAEGFEWRRNSDFKPMEVPKDRTSTRFEPFPARDHLLVDPFSQQRLEGMHRSDRRAFAGSSRHGVFFWSREADNALIENAKLLSAKVEAWKKDFKTKF